MIASSIITNDFLLAIQIRWKLRLTVIPLLAIRPPQIFAHDTTAPLSCHVQNFVAIAVLESKWEWNEISIEFEMRWKKTLVKRAPGGCRRFAWRYDDTNGLRNSLVTTESSYRNGSDTIPEGQMPSEVIFVLVELGSVVVYIKHRQDHGGSAGVPLGGLCLPGDNLQGHDDVIKWKHFPRNWPFVRGIHRSPVTSPHKGQWRRALMFVFFYLRLNKRLSKQSWGWWFETPWPPL